MCVCPLVTSCVVYPYWPDPVENEARSNPNCIFFGKLLVLKLILYMKAVKAYFLFAAAVNKHIDVGMSAICF